MKMKLFTTMRSLKSFMLLPKREDFPVEFGLDWFDFEPLQIELANAGYVSNVVEVTPEFLTLSFWHHRADPKDMLERFRLVVNLT